MWHLLQFALLFIKVLNRNFLVRFNIEMTECGECTGKSGVEFIEEDLKILRPRIKMISLSQCNSFALPCNINRTIVIYYYICCGFVHFST